MNMVILNSKIGILFNMKYTMIVFSINIIYQMMELSIPVLGVRLLKRSQFSQSLSNSSVNSMY